MFKPVPARPKEGCPDSAQQKFTAGMPALDSLSSEKVSEWERAVSEHTGIPISSEAQPRLAPNKLVLLGKRKAYDGLQVGPMKNIVSLHCEGSEASFSRESTPPASQEIHERESRRASGCSESLHHSDSAPGQQDSINLGNSSVSKDSFGSEGHLHHRMTKAAVQPRTFGRNFERDLHTTATNGVIICRLLEESLHQYCSCSGNLESDIARQVSDLARLSSDSRRRWEVYRDFPPFRSDSSCPSIELSAEC